MFDFFVQLLFLFFFGILFGFSNHMIEFLIDEYTESKNKNSLNDDLVNVAIVLLVLILLLCIFKYIKKYIKK